MDIVLPTKSNLIKIKKTIALSKQGKEFLEKKKLILIREREKYAGKKENLEQEFNIAYDTAFNLLKSCNVDIGVSRVIEIGEKIKDDNSLDIKYKTVMGVEIPSIVYTKKNVNDFSYGLYNTTISLDKAIKAFDRLKEIMIELTEIEITISRLDESIRKVQTRANSLKNIIIPRNVKIEHQITDILEERDREEFTRLKMIREHK